MLPSKDSSQSSSLAKENSTERRRWTPKMVVLVFGPPFELPPKIMELWRSNFCPFWRAPCFQIWASAQSSLLHQPNVPLSYIHRRTPRAAILVRLRPQPGPTPRSLSPCGEGPSPHPSTENSALRTPRSALQNPKPPGGHLMLSTSRWPVGSSSISTSAFMSCAAQSCIFLSHRAPANINQSSH